MSTETQSDDEIPPVEHIELTFRKCKVGPITSRYQNGKWVDVDPNQIGSEPSRNAVINLDNSYRGDWNVPYASDPVLVFQAPSGYTHQQLKELLSEHGMWRKTYTSIHIPHGNDKWKPGFRTSTSHTHMYERFKKKIKDNVSRDMDYREGENVCSAFLPVE